MSIKQAVRWAPRSSLVPTTALPLDHPKLQPPVHVVKKDERSKDPEVQRVALLPATIKSAKAKVTDAAVHYDRDRDAVVMRSFEGAEMTPEVFRLQFKRAFGVNLTMAETVATINDFDNDPEAEKMMDGAEFLRGFFQLGFEEKSRRERARRKAEAELAKQTADKEAKRQAELAKKNDLQVSFACGDKDLESAMAKVTEAAVKYDKNSSSSMSLDAFEGSAMPPHVFKEQLKRVFNLKLTPQELGALMKYFDKARARPTTPRAPGGARARRRAALTMRARLFSRARSLSPLFVAARRSRRTATARSTAPSS